MKYRTFWTSIIEKGWQKRSIIWLSGVRRVGKTFLCKSLQNIEYFDCELPRVRRVMEDNEEFLKTIRKKTVVFDEIHRLGNPSELLKIAADYYPDTKIIATGSSTLGASSKFRDTLSGRKLDIWLTPMIAEDLDDFAVDNFEKRLLYGGLPPFIMSDTLPEQEFQEWIDSYWAKDVQELFRLERRHSFQRFLELLMAQSGGIFEATRFSTPCEVSRTTISNYLAVLEATFVVHIIRPFSTRKTTEIVSAPKVYGFDTGFVCYFRGWHQLRSDDMGLLWEHFVLNELHGNLQTRDIRYWRDKRGHEVDFILVKRGIPPIAIECKWSASDFSPENMKSFRHKYPGGTFFVVSHNTDRAYIKSYDGIEVNFVSLSGLIKLLKED